MNNQAYKAPKQPYQAKKRKHPYLKKKFNIFESKYTCAYVRTSLQVNEYLFNTHHLFLALYVSMVSLLNY